MTDDAQLGVKASRGLIAAVRAWASRHPRIAICMVVVVWLTAAVLVGLATAGGVVWF